jgi:hypothetical protein
MFMKILRISQEEGGTGLNFDTMDSFVAFEAKLEGRVTFVVKEGSDMEAFLSKVAESLEQDFDEILPALRGAAVRKLDETDYKIVRIMKLCPIPTLTESHMLEVKLHPILLPEDVIKNLESKQKGS